MKDFSYYVYVVEKKINEMALQYNPDDANEFWNTHFKNSLDSVFTRDYAKQLAIDLCEYDYIMEYESTVYNLYLTDSDKQSCKSNAHDTYEDMSEKAHNNTKLTEDDIYNILCRKKLVEKYVTRAAQKVQKALRATVRCLIMMAISTKKRLRLNMMLLRITSCWIK